MDQRDERHSCWGLGRDTLGMNSGLQPSLCGVKGSRGLDSRPWEVPTQPPRLYSHRVAFCFLWSLRCHPASSLGDPRLLWLLKSQLPSRPAPSSSECLEILPQTSPAGLRSLECHSRGSPALSNAIVCLQCISHPIPGLLTQIRGGLVTAQNSPFRAWS